ncbi:YbaB/EbfC family nucleoid-associated protein [Mycobacteroides chelonae]|uniref:YbaB/EbfC family nucleoid-associated protein n=1 Tax=Mycobacteroides TaxID=670516 RepID=UPI00099242BB|nr:YbaB/EbfC family nucleoid-associated protein [Mycobacteroides chelonae]AYM40726.1 hypothetical protein DYE20_03370 [[Mycobacterium] chelonae subsp. gwanakae]GLE55298.1 hypothetical protein NJBCHELONAE_06090 [Mycobacteroides chelonae]
MSGLAESLMARIRKQRDLMQAMTDECHSISVTMVSKDQAVKVQVDGLGTMTGLWLSSQAQKLSADALAKLIIETAQAAAQHALERQRFLGDHFDKKFNDLRKTPLTRWDGSTFIPGKG